MEHLEETAVPAVEPVKPRFSRPPAWLFIVWCAVLFSALPVIKRELLRQTPVPPDDLVLSFRLYQSHRYPEAIAAAQKYLRNKPDSADALTNIGIAYAALGKWDDAIAATQRALLIKPDHQLAWNNLRLILAEQLAAHPTAESYQAQAVGHYQAGRYRECVDLAQRALKLYPQYTKAFNLLSVCYLNLGMFDDAVGNAQEAVRLEPAFQLARNNLRLALERRTNGPNTDSLLNSSLQNYRSGRMQACIDDARAALRINPKLAIAYNNVAACSNDLGRPDDAIAAANEALRLQPDFQLARNNLAVAVGLKSKR